MISERNYLGAIYEYESLLIKELDNKIKVKIFYQLGELYSIHIGNYVKASKYYNFIKKDSLDPLWLIKAEDKLGEIHYQFLKKYNEAILNYRNLQLFKPKLARFDFYEFRLAMSYQKLSLFLEAEKIFKKILKTDGHQYYLKALFQMGLVAFEQKKWKQSLIYWKSYLKKETRADDLVQTKFLMANVYEMMEMLKTAYNIYYSILGQYPNTEVVKNRLESIYNRRIARRR